MKPTILILVAALLPAAQAANKSCSVLTPGEVSAALKIGPVSTSPDQEAEAGLESCNYLNAKTGLKVGIYLKNGRAQLQKQSDNSEPGMKEEIVTGLRDKAVYIVIPGFTSEFAVLKGDTLIFMVTVGGTMAGKEVMRSLATKALSRM